MTYNVVGVWLDSTAPHPARGLADDPKLDPLPGVEGALAVGPANHHILSLMVR